MTVTPKAMSCEANIIGVTKDVLVELQLPMVHMLPPTLHRNLSFGQNPINCHSGVDNGCFFGDGQSPDSATIGAPQVAVVTTSDSCKHGLIPGNGCNSYHNPGVMHSMAETTDSNRSRVEGW